MLENQRPAQLPHFLADLSRMAALHRLSTTAFVVVCLGATRSFGQAGATPAPDVTAYSVACFCGDTIPWQLWLPNGYVATKPAWYGEGSVQAFRYADQSVITLLCGANAQLSLPKKKKKGFYDRKEVLPGCCYQLLYTHVPATRVAVFNRVFDQTSKR